MTSSFRNYFLGLFLLLSFNASATDTIVVAQDNYRIDENLNLIVVNRNVSDLNSQWLDSKSTILLDQYYTFSEEVSLLEVGRAYQITHLVDTYTLYFTELPIISINTPNTIPDDPRVYATFHMSESGGYTITSDLGIEIRGDWTQGLPKKSYRIEFWKDEEGEETRDVALLGMRSDDDWDLQAMYNEPLRVHSKTSNDLWLDIHQIYYKSSESAAINGIRSSFVEVFLNGNYTGVYALRERIDNKQLKLKSYNGSIRGELYKSSASVEPVYFGAVFQYDNTQLLWGGFEYEFPEEEVDWSNLHELVSFVVDSSDAYFYANYPAYLQKDNMVDYFIFLNLLKAKDNAGKNNFVARYKVGEPYYYVPWDLDGVFGNDWDGDQDPVFEGIVSNGIFDRLLNECSHDGFISKAQVRWNELRVTDFAYDSLMERFTANEDFLFHNGVYAREQMAWPDYAYDDMYIDYLSEWLKKRLIYMDHFFDQACFVERPSYAPYVFPNPASEYFTIDIDRNSVLYEVSICNANGAEVFRSTTVTANQEIIISDYPTGVYFVTITTDQTTKVQKVLVTK